MKNKIHSNFVFGLFGLCDIINPRMNSMTFNHTT